MTITGPAHVAGPFVIPADIDSCVSELGGIGRLIHAAKWERAAIVAAYVRLGAGRGTSSRFGRGTTGPFSASEFADLGICGLSSVSSVSKYVTAWLDAHEGIYPEPGATVELPADEFPSRVTPRVAERASRTCTGTRRDPDAVRQVLARYKAELTNPEFGWWAIENITDEAREAVAESACAIGVAMSALADNVESCES